MKEKTIDICRRVLKNFAAETVKFEDGKDQMDAVTAQMVVKVYDALSSKNQKKCDEMLMYKSRLVLLWKLVK